MIYIEVWQILCAFVPIITYITLTIISTAHSFRASSVPSVPSVPDIHKPNTADKNLLNK